MILSQVAGKKTGQLTKEDRAIRAYSYYKYPKIQSPEVAKRLWGRLLIQATFAAVGAGAGDVAENLVKNTYLSEAPTPIKSTANKTASIQEKFPTLKVA